jgi:BolA family transcriptional regulator, general stress-responsive regulator
MKSTLEILNERLQSLAPTDIEIIDESHLHAGHGSVGNYRLFINSPQFDGKSTPQAHRLVYQAVGDLLPNAIHSLSINIRRN